MNYLSINRLILGTSRAMYSMKRIKRSGDRPWTPLAEAVGRVQGWVFAGRTSVGCRSKISYNQYLPSSRRPSREGPTRNVEVAAATSVTCLARSGA